MEMNIMPEYIDRKVIEDAIEYLMNKYSKTGTNNQFSKDCLRYIQKKLRATPTVNVISIRRGRWLNSYPDIEPNPMFGYGTCSRCRFEQSISDKLPYCPNCGAKMDGGV